MVRKLILMSQPQSQQPSYHNRDSLNCQEKSQFSSPSDCSNCSIAASSSENSYTNSSSHPVTTMTNRPDSIDFEQISSNIMTGTNITSSNYLQIPNFVQSNGGRDLPKSLPNNLVYTPFSISISSSSCSSPNSIQTSNQPFLFSPPPTPPQKIQITTPFGSNEIVMIGDTIDQDNHFFTTSKAKNSPDSYPTIFFNRSFSANFQNLCCLCNKPIPGDISNNIITLSESDSHVNLPKSFTLNAAPQFTTTNTKTESHKSSHEQIFFKTQRSKSYSCQSSTNHADVAASLFLQPKKNFLTPGETKSNYSCNVSTRSFQSLASDSSNKNKLNLPGANAKPESYYSSSVNVDFSPKSSRNLFCLNCTYGSSVLHPQSTPPIHRSLSTLCTSNKHLQTSHSMYNFDAASFPEFNYIKTHMLKNDLTPLAHSSTLVDAFLKNFDKGLNSLQSRSEVLIPSQSTEHSSKIDCNNVSPTLSKSISSRLTSIFSKSSSKLSHSFDNRSATSATYEDNNHPNSQSTSFSSSSRFLNIYKNYKQSHSTTELNRPEFIPCTSQRNNIPTSSNNQEESSSPYNRPKSYLFDFYSFYNNKYNVENERRRQSANISYGRSRNQSISGATSLIVQQLRLRRESKPEVSQNWSRVSRASNNEYYITHSSHFNMKKFASSFARDIKSKASNLLRRRHTDASISDKSLLPSRDEYVSWSKSFENLLRHKYGIALFRGFLKTEFSDENIEFWIECEDYKFINKELKRDAKAKKIYSDFVAIGSPREVNLDIEIRAHTAQQILNPSFDTFERAQKRITALMEKDSYPRFLESDLYKNLISDGASASNGTSSNHGGMTSRNSLTSNKSFNESLPSTSNKSLFTPK